MAKSRETFNKKEKEKKKRKKKQAKEERKKARKADGAKGTSLEDMIAYVDENGNISSTPPDPEKKQEINHEDIEIGVSRREDTPDLEGMRSGVVTFFNDSKGYGFIKDLETGESVFVHISQLEEEIAENDKVNFNAETTPNGLKAFDVKRTE